nr:hypothetical protein FRC18_007059 [Serendipita sp. 400]
MNMDTDETKTTLLPTHSLKFRPTLGPFLSSKSSLEDAFESGSSRPQSLTSHEMSVFSTSSEASNEVRQPQSRVRNRNAPSGLNAYRRKTRDLVNLFERNSLDDCAGQASSQPLRRGLKPTERSNLGGLTKSKPLRESFRNLVLVFNKAKRTLGDHSVSRKQSIDKEGALRLSDLDHNSTSREELLSTNMPAPTLSHIAPSLPQDIRSGILLCYDELTASWHRCNAFLAPPNLRLDYFLASGKPITRVVPVGKADDARSATFKSSSMIQPPLLDDKTPHVFQVEFRDGTIQTLAACSVLERGGWISAIWDAIITCKSTARSKPHLTEKSSIDETGFSEHESKELHDIRATNSPSRNSEDVTLVIPPVLPLRTKSSKSSRSRWSASEISVESNPMNTTRSVKQRVALFNGLSDTRAAADDVYATPPRTPPPLDARQSHRASLSKQVAIRNLSAHVSDDQPVLLGTIDSVPESLAVDEEMNVEYEETASLGASTSPPPLVFDDSFSVYRTPSVPLRLVSSGTMSLYNLPPAMKTQEPQNLEPVLEVIHQNAHVQNKEYEKLRRRVSNMHKEVKLAIQQPPLPVPQLDDLRERVEALANGIHSADLRGLHTKFDNLQSLQVDSEAAGAATSRDVVLEEIQLLSKLVQELKEHQSLVKPEMENMRNALETLQEQTIAHDLPPPVPAKDHLPDPLVALQSPLQSIEDKLAALESLISDMKVQESTVEGNEPLRSLSVFRSRSRKDPPDEQVASSMDDPQVKITEILSIVTEERDQHMKTAEQFEDSIRYLNELNTWMEAFVTKTAGHEELLHAILSTLEKLTGAAEEIKKDEESTENRKESASEAESKNNTLIELKAALGDFTKALNDFKNEHATTNILSTIEKNRAEQEALLRHIAGELSADIRGDRLRFVEAMREATTINVSIHLDEFKRRLSEEVSAMLHDVGRMARDRERKYLEQEIQDIFRQQQQQHHHQQQYPSQLALHPRHPQLDQHHQQQQYRVQQQQQQHPQGQMDGRRSSVGFQPLPPRSALPSRPTSAGPYPAFMVPPIAPSSRAGMHTPGPVPLLRPMPLHPDLAGVNNNRPLPSPTGIGIHPAQTPVATQPVLDAAPTRRKA